MAIEINSIRQLAYELYKIDWMRQISPERQMDSLRQYYDDKKLCPGDTSVYNDIIDEFGYDGDIYETFDEFLESKYLEADYMKALLNSSQYEDYEKDVENSS